MSPDELDGEIMWRRGAKVAFAIVAAMVAVVISAGPAMASSTNYNSYGGVLRGHGTFESYGDHWWACDVRGDGYGIRVDWYVAVTGRSGNVYDRSGADGQCGHMNVDIGEGREVFYRVCIINDGTTPHCTGYFRDVA
jgi:hypothetical protein